MAKNCVYVSRMDPAALRCAVDVLAERRAPEGTLEFESRVALQELLRRALKARPAAAGADGDGATPP